MSWVLLISFKEPNMKNSVRDCKYIWSETYYYVVAAKFVSNMAFIVPFQSNLNSEREWWWMAGYVGDEQATSATLDSEGWLKTGDLCYFDADGFLYVVDRLKELIKYKAYQVVKL